MYDIETNSQAVGRAAHVIIDAVMGLLQPQSDGVGCASIKDAAEPSTLNQTLGETLGDAYAGPVHDHDAYQRRSARETAIHAVTNAAAASGLSIQNSKTLVAAADTIAQFILDGEVETPLSLLSNYPTEMLVAELSHRVKS